ncbi:MAG: hypothetical protein EHM23_29110 [Acidobacteria bacterium]|nr:MAG: hypothetical protein EHM23_29110 [Acidobacteriota bacterium]
MKGATIAGGAFVIILVFLALVQTKWTLEQYIGPGAATSPAPIPSNGPAEEATQDFLHGRVTTDDGVTYEGRLRFGGDEEAFWGNYFNGVKDDNPWSGYVPPERLTRKRPPIEIFGFEISRGERQIDLRRPLMARFGDIARIEARARDLWVTLKSGTRFHLDRFAADDFADGLRVWDGRRGVVNLDEWRIRAIEFLPTGRLEGAPDRLHGTVRTGHGEFTGFIQWDRQACVSSDELVGHSAEGKLTLRFDTIRSIARRSRDSALVTLHDGRDIVLSDTRDVGNGHGGIYVDDRRYGRVLVSWNAFERIDFSAGGSGPTYTDFPPGRPLTGSVTTRAGRSLTGRLVYDLDESETTETLDAPSRGVDYTIPFGLIASIVLGAREERGAQPVRVTLHNGEELQLEPAGDLGEANAGMLIFVAGRQRPEYVPWTDIEQVDLDRPSAMYPPLAGR